MGLRSIVSSEVTAWGLGFGVLVVVWGTRGGLGDSWQFGGLVAFGGITVPGATPMCVLNARCMGAASKSSRFRKGLNSSQGRRG